MIKERVLKNSIYTLDKLTLQFIMRTQDAQFLMDKFSYDTTINSRTSNKKTGCHYNYYIDLEGNNSFWIGFEPNWKKKELMLVMEG